MLHALFRICVAMVVSVKIRTCNLLSGCCFVVLCFPLLSFSSIVYEFSPTGNLPPGCVLNVGSTTTYTCGVLTLAADVVVNVGSIKPIKILVAGAFVTGAGVFINRFGSALDVKLLVEGAMTLGAGSILNLNLRMLNNGALVMGAASVITGTVTTGPEPVEELPDSPDLPIGFFSLMSLHDIIAAAAFVITFGIGIIVGLLS